MDGRGAGGLSGLIDEVRAEGRRVTRGGRRRARGGRGRRLGGARGQPPAGRARPSGAPRPGSAEGAASAEAPPGAWRPGARGPLPPRGPLASRPPLAREPAFGGRGRSLVWEPAPPGQGPLSRWAHARTSTLTPGGEAGAGVRGRGYRRRGPGRRVLSLSGGAAPCEAGLGRRHRSQRRHNLGGE